ncbi:alpha/beta fold hydrolase [Pseudomonas sp. LRF_L74]|uniref:alpha/beta fold hydrolase n=1 Tax=Pseudomonas sp. LRF_L74 TaxID=3369422 RepID=UPI003F643C25
MKPEIAVLDIQGQYRVYTEFYRAESAEHTIILVNGSLSTTTSFSQTVRYLLRHMNVVLFDLPYAGQSREHNDHSRLMSRDEEADILNALIEHFACDQVMSFSWGGIATLQALARKPRGVTKAIIASFSPITNEPMQAYLQRAVEVLSTCDRDNIGSVLNNTIGSHLPSLLKRYNDRHLGTLEDYEYFQMSHHVQTVLNMEGRSCTSYAEEIDIPLLFVNGEQDAYTTPDDARLFARHVQRCDFRVIPQAGHFLDMENRTAWMQTRDALLAFLIPPVASPSRSTVQVGQAIAV